MNELEVKIKVDQTMDDLNLLTMAEKDSLLCSIIEANYTKCGLCIKDLETHIDFAISYSAKGGWKNE